ncbi:hypothetical protein VTN00DRAFT_4655 [Thermoascus crustaceus]|uniref:uncharacterized protein n=1 Tax=Thermoascus crustaceus TaxID=5088 RepID=UPI00374486B9
MAVQLQWSLDSSVNSVLSVARGIFKAASTDNVQPLAILAYERFGNTLTMCQETCKKVDALMSRTAKPVPVQFLRVLVGFQAEDLASQISKSLAGIQFLCLTAAMVTSMGAFAGANALAAMLISSASDKTLLPTPRQLQDLLERLEPRCHWCGFIDMVVGWQVFLRQCPGMTEGHRKYWKVSNSYSPTEGLEKLVDAFRQLSRISESEIIRIMAYRSSMSPIPEL